MERLYTCEEIAQRYSVKVPTVWRWIRNKQLPAINLNGSGYRVSESDLVAFEESKRVRGMLMKLYVFTKKDIDRFLTECNFTPDEERLFRLRCKEHTLEYCAEQMNVSISTAKRLSRRVNNKIIKVC